MTPAQTSQDEMPGSWAQGTHPSRGCSGSKVWHSVGGAALNKPFARTPLAAVFSFHLPQAACLWRLVV